MWTSTTPTSSRPCEVFIGLFCFIMHCAAWSAASNAASAHSGSVCILPSVLAALRPEMVWGLLARAGALAILSGAAAARCALRAVQDQCVRHVRQRPAGQPHRRRRQRRQRDSRDGHLRHSVRTLVLLIFFLLVPRCVQQCAARAGGGLLGSGGRWANRKHMCFHCIQRVPAGLGESMTAAAGGPWLAAFLAATGSDQLHAT